MSPLGKSNHCGLVFDFMPSDRLIIPKKKRRLKINYLKKNYNLMRSEFETIDWSEISESDDAEIVCQNIENLILSLIQRFVP